MKNLSFVFLSNKMDQGSTNMRVHQLAQMISPHLPEDYQLELSPIKIPHKWIRNKFTIKNAVQKWALSTKSNSLYFVSKACIQHFTPDIIEIVQSKNSLIAFDHVDSDFSIGPQGSPDIHICSSITQLKFVLNYKENNPSFKGEPKLLLHNYDIKLINFGKPQNRLFKCAYVGTPSVAYLPNNVLDKVDIVTAMGVGGMSEIISLLPNFNAHYGLRLPQPHNSLLAKPFTKGFVAAACGAVIITDRSTHDAEYLLGADYPFMVNSLDPQETEDMLNFMEDSFGSNIWLEAERRMQEIKELVSPKRLADTLRDIMHETT